MCSKKEVTILKHRFPMLHIHLIYFVNYFKMNILRLGSLGWICFILFWAFPCKCESSGFWLCVIYPVFFFIAVPFKLSTQIYGGRDFGVPKMCSHKSLLSLLSRCQMNEVNCLSLKFQQIRSLPLCSLWHQLHKQQTQTAAPQCLVQEKV